MNNMSVFNERMLLERAEPEEVVPSYVPVSHSYITDNSISGQIIGASSDDGYKRLWMRKVFDRVMYGSRMSNVVQTIVVRCQDGVVDRDVQLLCYGKLNGGVNSLRTGSEIIAEGKFDGKSRFIAKRMRVGNAEVEIKMEMADIMVFVVPILILIAIMLWNPLISLLPSAGVGGKLSALTLPFAGGFFGTMHLIKKKAGYFIPFRYRIKAGLAVGIILALLIAVLFH
ncbi:MAG: hypothetical protein PUB52_02105 [Lachnospiraceae bacterium]|nr:hypothetical protein [Lachnospiraceae bacterium]